VLPPCLLHQVAVSIWPGALLRHVALVCVPLAVLPWFQQYPRAGVGVARASGGHLGAGGTEGRWAHATNWLAAACSLANSARRAANSGPVGRVAAVARAVPVALAWFVRIA
jgi:hypothetical protein